MNSWGCLTRIGLAALGLVWTSVWLSFAASNQDSHAESVTEAMTARTVAHEVALARNAGLTLVSDRVAQRGAREQVALRPGGCFALVVHTTGEAPLAPLAVRDADDRLVGSDVDVHAEGFVRHVCWCAPRGGRFSVSVSGGTAPRVLRFEGQPPRSRWPLARTRPVPAAVEALRHEVARTEFDAAREGGVHLAEWEGASTHGATLLPETPATRAVLRAAMGLAPDAALSVGVQAESPPGVVPYAVVDGRRSRRSRTRAPTVTLLGDALRMVAVLDPGAFHRRCVTLRVVASTPSAESLYRVDVPGWQVHALPRRGGFFTDRRCADQSLPVYALRADAEVSLRFALDAEAGEEDPAVVGSEWRGEGRPHSLFGRLQAECDRDVDACMTLGFLGSSALPPPLRPNALAAFRQACTLGHAEACARSAQLARDPADSQELLHRACERGMALACVLHGERARLGRNGFAFNLAVAFDSYTRGCNLGAAIACHQRDTMSLLDLVP